MQSLIVRHNMEVAHRLSKTPGKCEHIHGHSMWVDLEIVGEVDNRGFVCGLDFALVKKVFREHLDTNFDHRLLLNKDDFLAMPVHPEGHPPGFELPGLHVCADEPTTENIARWIGEWAEKTITEFCRLEPVAFQIEVAETSVNLARWANE